MIPSRQTRGNSSTKEARSGARGIFIFQYQNILIAAAVLNLGLIVLCTKCYYLKLKRRRKRTKRKTVATNDLCLYAVSQIFPNTEVHAIETVNDQYETIRLQNVYDQPYNENKDIKKQKIFPYIFNFKKTSKGAGSTFYLENEIPDVNIYEDVQNDQYDNLHNARKKKKQQPESHYGKLKHDHNRIYDVCRLGVEETAV